MSGHLVVSGGTGFLGSRLVRIFAERGWRVSVLTRATSSTHRLAPVCGAIELIELGEVSFDDLFERDGVDIVLHAAANFGRGQSSREAIEEANYDLPMGLAEALGRRGQGAFVHLDTVLAAPTSPYAAAKKRFAAALPKFADGLTCINLPLAHCFGPDDDPEKFVAWLVRSLLADLAVLDFTPGLQRRDFIYVDDAVAAIVASTDAFATSGPGHHEVEVGSGTPVTIREFVTRVQAACDAGGSELRFGTLPYRENEMMEAVANTNALTDLGWSPRFGLHEAIELTVAAEREYLASCVS